MSRRRYGMITAATLLIALVLVSACPIRARPTPDIPVILIHGLGGSAASTWGFGQSKRFAAELAKKGYVAGKTLFVLDYADEPCGDYTEISARLPQVIEHALSASGATQVDIISHSMGALIARHYTAGSSYRGDVRNVVMLSPPNRGSFVATAAALKTQVLRHERGLSLATQELSEKQAYVRQQADLLYAPLYRQFVATRFMSRESGHTGLGFEEWIAMFHPHVYERILSSAHKSLARDAESAPAPEDALTQGYYEYVALHVARNNHIQSVTLPSRQLEALLGPRLGEQSLPAHLLLRGVLRLLDPLLKKVRTLLRQAVVRGGAALFGVDLDGPALLRLVEEAVDFPRGRSGGKLLYDALPANWYLALWNREDAADRLDSCNKRPGSTPRYIIVSSKVPNLAGLLWKAAQENDFAVELSATHLPPALDDIYQVVSGMTAHHLSLTGAVQASKVLALLEQRQPVASVVSPRWDSSYKFGAWSHRQTLRASDWEPRYLRLTSSAVSEGCDLWLEVKCSDKAFIFWVDILHQDGGESRVVVSPAARRVVVPDFGAQVTEVRAGFRLDAATTTHERERTTPLEVLVGTLASGMADGARLNVLPAIAETPTSYQQPDGRTSLATSGKRDTTLAHATATEALTWSWEVSGRQDVPGVGPVMRQTFEQPGVHRVTATCRDSGGGFIEKWQWDVRTDVPGETREFRATTEHYSPEIQIEAPLKWLTGKPALIRVHVSAASQATYEVLSVDPGREFYLTWHKPGRFPVKVAVTVRSRYELDGVIVVSTRTYLKSVFVEVLSVASTG